MIPIIKQRTPCADKHDKLGWKEGCVYRMPEGTLGLRTNERGYLKTLQQFVPDFGQVLQAEDGPVEVDWLLSFRRAQKSTRKGVRNYNIGYDAWVSTIRSLDEQSALREFSYLVAQRLLKLSDAHVHLLGSVFQSRDLSLFLTDVSADLPPDLIPSWLSELSDKGLILDALGNNYMLEQQPEGLSLTRIEKSLGRILIVRGDVAHFQPQLNQSLSPAEGAVHLFGRACGMNAQARLVFLAKLSKELPVVIGRPEFLAQLLADTDIQGRSQIVASEGPPKTCECIRSAQ